MSRLIPSFVRIISGPLLLLILVLGQAQAQNTQQYNQGLLWEITPASGKPSYLFGTIHSDDSRVINLPIPVKSKFEQARVFCAEMKMDMATQIRMSQGMMYLNGQRLNQKIDESLYRKTVSLVANYGIPETMAPMLKPWAAGLMLSIPKPETGMFLDYMLYQNAQEAGKELCGLETPAEIVDMFDNTPLQTQVNLLRSAVREYPNMDKTFEEMLKLYLARDLAGLSDYSDKELEKSGKDVSALVNDKLVAMRNRNMLKTMQEHLSKGHAFIAVGALHLPGEYGMLRMLEDQGYRVKAIY